MIMIFESFLSSLRVAPRDDVGRPVTGDACAPLELAALLFPRGLSGLLVSLVGFAKTWGSDGEPFDIQEEEG